MAVRNRLEIKIEQETHRIPFFPQQAMPTKIYREVSMSKVYLVGDNEFNQDCELDSIVFSL